MITRILTASTLRGVAVLAAALDSGCFGDSDRRVLLLTDNAAVPEAAPTVDAMPGFDRLRTRFDDVLSWNEAIAPFHPSGWTPRADDVPLWERHLRRAWNLADDEIELTLESLHVSPARAIAEIFTGVPIDVYADGLSGYGPTGGKVHPLIGTRVGRLLHTDPVPGLRPLLLAEFGAEPTTVPAASLIKVFTELADAAPESPAATRAPALILGECLCAPGLLSASEERELYLGMVRGIAALGHTRVLFAPHPLAPVPWQEALTTEAARLDVRLTVLDTRVLGTPVLPEVLYQRVRPALVVGSFAAELFSAVTLYGLPVARAGTGTLLERLTPYEHDSRVPVTIADALLPDLSEAAAVRDWTPPAEADVTRKLGGLVPAVAFAMQPRVRPDLRPAAERYLADRLNSRTWRYFKRRRLASLALPGVVPARLAFVRRNATVRRIARRARALAQGAGG